MSERIKINIQHGIKSIPANAFLYKKLYGVTFPNTLEEIGVSAFCNNELTSVIFPDNLVKIGAYSFANNVLNGTIVLPKGIKEIGVSAFAFNEIKKVVIPNEITKIDAYAFSHNKIKNLVIPSSTLELGRYAFSCNELETVVIEDGLKVIPEGLFDENNSLKQIVIPKSVEKIENNAFCNVDVIYDGVKISKEEIKNRDCSSIILIAKDKKRLNEIHEKKFSFYNFPSNKKDILEEKNKEPLKPNNSSNEEKVTFKDADENIEKNNEDYHKELSDITSQRQMLEEQMRDEVLKVQKLQSQIKALNEKEQEIYYKMMFDKIKEPTAK